MRLFGISLLVIGFLWIALESASYTGRAHGRWMWQSQRLPTGETIKRNEAIGAMRELSLALKESQSVVLFPALLMLAGGLTAAFSRRTHRHDT